MKDLSKKAIELLQIIKDNNGSIWEDKAADLLYNKPIYSRDIEAATKFWQWEVNFDLVKRDRPINGVNLIFTPNIEVGYSQLTYNAAKELKNKGLINIPNKGYNTYSYELK